MRNIALLLLVCFFTLPLHAESAPCAHRGDVAAAPENTLPAFVSAVQKGAAQIEFDLHRTKDGYLVLLHDNTLDRTTNGTGKPQDFTLEELRKLDAGSWYDKAYAGVQIPMFAEVLAAIPPGIWCNIHLKQGPGLAEAAAKTLKKLGRLDYTFLACTVEQIKEARAVVPEIKTCNMSRQGNDRPAYIALTLEIKSEFIQLHRGQGMDGLKEDVAALHAAGVRVNWFGTEDPEVIRALSAAGVDYILTDTLDGCIDALNQGPIRTAVEYSKLQLGAKQGTITMGYPVFPPEALSWNRELNRQIAFAAAGQRTRFIGDFNATPRVGSQDGVSLRYHSFQLLESEFGIVSERVASVMLHGYTFTGGAHGNHIYTVLNLQHKTDGSIHPMGLSNVIDYLVLDKLREQGATQVVEGKVATIAQADLNLFLLTSEGLRFVFPPYSMGAYSEGTYTVDLSIDELSLLLLPEAQMFFTPKS